MLNKALEICYKAHKQQVDKGGNPYYLHPIQVALMCDTNQEKIVALLHDVLEDTTYNIEDLKKAGFDNNIIEAIMCLTKTKDEEYDQYIKRVITNPIAKKVKKNDLIHNSDLSRIKEITSEDLKRIEKYKKYIQILNHSK